MTVGELIEKLQEFDKNLHVYLEDWSEGYAYPLLLTKDEIAERDKRYLPGNKILEERHIIFGDGT